MTELNRKCVFFSNCKTQEGYLSKYAVSEEDKLGAEESRMDDEPSQDPMRRLEELDVAGPKPE
jgi:peptidylprolyl isomerase